MAARTEDRKFGTFALTAAANGVSINTWRGRLLHDTDFHPRQKADGSIAGKDRFTGYEIALGGEIGGADTGLLKTNVDAFLQAITSGEEYLSLFNDRRLLCRLAADWGFDHYVGHNVLKWSATFRSRFPHWESTTQSSVIVTPTGAGPHNVSLGANAATAPTYPKVKITNNGATFSDKQFTLTNAGTGVQIQVAGLGMGAGDVITCDMKEGQLGDGTATVITPFSIDSVWWWLSPGASTTMEFAHNVGSGASWDVTTTWYDAHWYL
jgi:hypothetical protein